MMDNATTEARVRSRRGRTRFIGGSTAPIVTQPAPTRLSASPGRAPGPEGAGRGGAPRAPPAARPVAPLNNVRAALPLLSVRQTPALLLAVLLGCAGRRGILPRARRGRWRREAALAGVMVG